MSSRCDLVSSGILSADTAIRSAEADARMWRKLAEAEHAARVKAERERDRLLLVLTRVEQRLTFRGPPYDLLGDVRAALAEPIKADSDGEKS